MNATRITSELHTLSRVIIGVLKRATPGLF